VLGNLANPPVLTQELLILRTFFDGAINLGQQCHEMEGITSLKQLMRRLVWVKTLSIKGSGVFGIDERKTHSEIHE
jgi:hypothetical protein